MTVCAFTTKTWKFLKMMGSRGWDITLYGGEDSDVRDYAELVPLYTQAEQDRWFGEMDANTLPIVAGAWDSRQPQYAITNARAIMRIEERYERGDLILLTGGLAQQPIVEGLPGKLFAEWAAGYDGWFLPYVCFESYAWRHYQYGKHQIDGRWFDTVIPNFFDPEEWSLWPKEDYLVFVGRLIHRKGPHVAAVIAKELGMPLYIAGSGAKEWSEGLLVTHDGLRMEGDIHYVGTVGRQERDELMGKARVLLCPTLYVEPFGAVAVEAPLCGTPSVATDWGAFTETVPAERRFSTLQEGCEAVEQAMECDPMSLQDSALQRFSLDSVAPLYERWFEQLETLHEKGWYQMKAKV